MPRQAGEAVAIISNHVQFDASKSPEGSRAWERLPELPTPEEVNSQTASSDELPWFPLNQKWDSKAQYLEAVYSILRFEGVEGLRYSVKCLRDNPSMMDDDNTCVYTKASPPPSSLPNSNLQWPVLFSLICRDHNVELI